MPDRIDPKYCSAVIVVGPKVTVPEDMLHYLVAVHQADGTVLLAPTQGKLVSLGELSGLGEVWAYLRYHREPFYLHVQGPVVELLTIALKENVPAASRLSVEAMARTEVVFDRRHMRVDSDFETPGLSSDATIGYDLRTRN